MMPKIVSISTLFVVLAVLASPAAFAQGTPDGETPANEGVCDELLGGTPGLYGLCVGFCEAQDCEATFDPTTGDVTIDPSCKPSSEKLVDNYNKRAQPEDPIMPCLNVVEAECPCWTPDELTLIADGTTTFCGSITPERTTMGGFDLATGGIDFVEQQTLSSRPFSCIYRENTPRFFRFINTNLEETTACIESIEAECFARGF